MSSRNAASINRTVSADTRATRWCQEVEAMANSHTKKEAAKIQAAISTLRMGYLVSR